MPKAISKSSAASMTTEELVQHSEECLLPVQQCPACDFYMNGAALKEGMDGRPKALKGYTK